MTVWQVVLALWAVGGVGCIVGWVLHDSVQHARGGMIDLTPAAADGSLGLDWRDSRPVIRYEYQPDILASDPWPLLSTPPERGLRTPG